MNDAGTVMTVLGLVPALSAGGVPDETIRTITYDNPRRWLTGV